MSSSLASQPTTTDAQLDLLLQRRAAFLGFLRARVGEEAAADILQSAYMRALEKSGQIENTESVVAWFYRVLRNAVVDHVRRTSARDRTHERFAAEAPISYEAELEANICECVNDMLPTLKYEYRTALECVDLGGQSTADFAAAQQITPNNAAVRLHRARKAAAEKLTELCGTCAAHGCLDCTCKTSRIAASAG